MDLTRMILRGRDSFLSILGLDGGIPFDGQDFVQDVQDFLFIVYKQYRFDTGFPFQFPPL